MKKIELLDCTLRDGAYVVDAKFGTNVIRGIINNLQNANVDIIECGWLKDMPHEVGTTYFHVPDDLKQYMIGPKSKFSTYVMMIDYNRYDCSRLPVYDGETIDAIRVVFPKDKVAEGVKLVDVIRNKGYRVFLQAANTLGYTDAEILELVNAVNKAKPEGLSIVDTFGAMYPSDLMRIMSLINNNLDKDIKLGFHSHNNQQLSFALSMQFVDSMMKDSKRNTIIIDSSLCGMGRGAGNTNTELMTYYLNNSYGTNYDMNVIMDAIDIYMTQFMDEHSWGYSTPYSIAGMYGCHVNNVAYLSETHRTRSKDMRIIFESLSKDMRTQYNYDNLEKIYIDYMNKEIDGSVALAEARNMFQDKKLVVILPGSSVVDNVDKVKEYIRKKDAIVVGINSIVSGYKYDCLFFSNSKKYEYAKENFAQQFTECKRIISSNIKTEGDEGEIVVNYNDLQKRCWRYYDNSMIMFLRLLSSCYPEQVYIAGFDGYLGGAHYATGSLVANLPVTEFEIMHKEIEEMLRDYVEANNNIKLKCITESPFSSIFK